MTTQRLHSLGAFALAWVSTASLIAAPIGRPTPCPCTADGSCSPSGPWGYSQTAWRLWPGTKLDQRGDAESSAVGAGSIGPARLPDPRGEDKLAPPKVEALDPQPEEPRDTEFELPDVEEFENGEPAEREAEGPDRLAPQRPGFMDRAPGGFQLDAAPAGEGAPAAQPTLPFGQPPAAPPTELFPSSSSEAPVQGPSLGMDSAPPLPFGLTPHRRLAKPRPVRPAQVVPVSAQMQIGSHQAAVARIPVQASQQPVVSQRVTEAPPQLPGSLLRSR